MKSNRRDFLKKSALSTAALSIPTVLAAETARRMPAKPVVVSTWNHGMPANKEAWDYIINDRTALDAIEAGVKISEADPRVSSVGYGGFPDRDGKVSLDACIMTGEGDCGSVSFLQHIKHPISVARKVMEETEHIMLSGEGALQFALKQGFQMENLLTEEAKKRWEIWKAKGNPRSIINGDNHDTIGMLAIDRQNRIAGACTTSGLAWKMHGRVGDSPIIGAGLYVDDEVGGAVATGVGEAVIKVVGSFLVVELMRQGFSPEEACAEAIERIAKKQNIDGMQVGFLAINKSNQHGAFALRKGFQYALTIDNETYLKDSKYLIEE